LADGAGRLVVVVVVLVTRTLDGSAAGTLLRREPLCLGEVLEEDVLEGLRLVLAVLAHRSTTRRGAGVRPS